MIPLGLISSLRIENGETRAYLAAMAVRPNKARIRAIDASYTRMKARSYWSKLDWLAFTAAHNEQAGRINLKNPAQVASLIGAPVFTVDEGFAGATDGSTGIDTGFNPSTAGGNYTLNSAHIGVWNLTEEQATGWQELSAGQAQLWSYYAPYFYARTNTGTLTQIAPPNGIATGHRSWSRTGVSSVAMYGNGVNVLNDTTVADTLPTTSFITASHRTVGALHIGGGLTDAEMAALHSDIGAYFNDTGIIPKYDVFLVIGDSNNANGFGFDAAIDLPSPFVDAMLDDVANGRLFNRVKTAAVDYYSAGFSSYVVAFFRDFYNQNGGLTAGRKVLIMQTSGGGTALIEGLAEWSVPSGSGYVNTVQRASQVLAAFPGATLKGVLGIVGANDASVSVSDAAWQTALDNLISSLRANIPGATNLPVILGGIPPNYLGVGTAAAINAKIVGLPARVAHTQYANPSSPTVLNHTADAIHYDAQDSRGTLGAPGGMAGRFWTAWQALT